MIKLNGENLTIDKLVQIARFKKKFFIDDEAKRRVVASSEKIKEFLKENKIIYGVTTGFGSLASIKITSEKLDLLQRNLILSHSCGVGKPLSEEIVRAIIVIRINTFLKGYSGVRLEIIEFLIDILNKNIYPFIPEKGSVGSSGDLAPLSHLVLLFYGRGEVIFKNKRIKSYNFLLKKGFKFIDLKAKEGLALNNGTSVMSAIGCLMVYDARKIFYHAVFSSCLTFEAIKAKSQCLDFRIHNVRPHKGQIRVAYLMRNILKGSFLIDSMKEKVQDAYSIRATPVVLGACLDSINYVENVLDIEINSSTDNPLIFDNEVLSGANFHGEPVALALDFLAIAISEIASISERRIARLVDKNLNEGLPAFLVADSGFNSGYMIPQYTAAALVSENKYLSHPSSVDSIPTCANQEDHVSMGTNSARKLRDIVFNVKNVLAIEFITVCQALDFTNKSFSTVSKQIYEEIRFEVKFYKEDREHYKDIERITNLIDSEILIKKIKVSLGGLL